jgi:inner centromere protein
MHSTDVSDMTLRENTNAMSMSNVDDTPKPTAASTPCNENGVVKKKPATKPKHDETTPLKREKSKRQVRQKHCEDKVDQAAKQREEIIKDKAERARRDREERQRRVDQNNKLQDQLRHEKEEAVRQQLDRVKKYEEEQRDKNQLLSPRSNMPGPSGCSKPTNMGASSRTAPSRIPKPAAAFFSPGKVAVPPKKNKTPITVAVDLKSPAVPPRDDSKRKRPVGTKKAEEEEKKLQVQMEAAREKEEADRKKKEMALQKQREEEERQRKLQEELERQEEEEVAEAEKSLATLKLEPADEAGDHADDDDEVVPDSLLMQASDEKTEEVKENKAPDGEEAGNKSSYDMTMEKVFLPSTDENYNVDDLSSNDETDDEERPRKIVPKWAQKSSLRERVMYLRDVLPEENRERYFGRIPAPNVEMFFPNSIKKYKPRSSSAHWNSPLAQPSRGISRYNEVRK